MPNQSNTFKARAIFLKGKYALISSYFTLNLTKTQILYVKYGIGIYEFLLFSSIGLATIGVCVFCASASVGALFLFIGGFL